MCAIMIHMKKKSILFVLSMMALCLSACGTSSNDNTSQATSAASSDTATSAASSDTSTSSVANSSSKEEEQSSQQSRSSSSSNATTSNSDDDEDLQPTIPNYVLHGLFYGESEWTDKALVQNPYSTTEYMIQGVSLHADDVFKIHMYGNTWYGYSDVKSSTPSGLVTAAASDGNIKVRTTGIYDIYCDYNESDGGHIYLARTDETTPISGDVAVTGISLSNTGKYLLARHEFTITATVLPANATNKKVYWTSSDTSIATVTSGGRVVGNVNGNKGTVTITAKTEDGNKTATCIIYVSASSTFPSTPSNPDYCLTGTIGGNSYSYFKQKYAAIPISTGRYLIPDVELVSGDSVSVIDNTGTSLKNKTNQKYTKSVSKNVSVNVYLNINDANKDYLSFEPKASS